jgi:NADH-quinone oxidoreductase subunit C
MKPTVEEITAALKEEFGESIISQEQQYDFTVITIDKNSVFNVVKFLYDHDSFRFRYLTTIAGVHNPALEKPFYLMYQLHSLEHNIRLRFKAYTSKDNMEFDSLIPVFSAANWMEREAFDFYGFTFKGHPKMIRILNVEDMDYFPMRKEYGVEDETRYDKDDTMFGREPANFKKLV